MKVLLLLILLYAVAQIAIFEYRYRKWLKK